MRRLWEIIPGFTTWVTIIGLLILAFINSHILAVIILIYSIFWLIKVFLMTGYLVAGYFSYKRDVTIDWFSKLKKDFPRSWRRLHHLIIIPTYKEDISILRHNLQAIVDSDYPNDRLIVILAFEAREEGVEAKMSQLTYEFEHKFAHLMTTIHPANIPGEVKGKGPNITWAARQFLPVLNKLCLDPENVITTTLDADSRVDRRYFACVSWEYLNDPDPVHKSFQPLPMYFNNIWQIPMLTKATNLGSSFWQLNVAMRPQNARNFASHAQSFAALIRTDFWSVTTVVEDGHQFWRTFFAFNGKHLVVPVFVPIYMDAVEGDNLYDSMREQYLQRRRWYWGVSDVPYVFINAWRNRRINWWLKWKLFLQLWESHYSLATQSYFLMIGWLPLQVDAQFRQSVLGYNFPTIYRVILFAAWIGMIASMWVASNLVPPRPGKRSVYILTLIKEWIFAPIILPLAGIFFSALPAIDSQTRLMLHKPFTVFNVTKKAVVKTDN